MIELLKPEFLVSTGAGAGVVWGMVKIHLEYILREQKRQDERITRLERRRSKDYEN